MYENQIKEREQLLEHHKEMYYRMLDQIQDLKSKQGLVEIEKFITDIGLLPISIKSEKYNPNVHRVREPYDKEKVAQMFKDLDIQPIKWVQDKGVQKIFKGDVLEPKQYSTSTSEGVSVNYSTAEGIKQMNQFLPQKEIKKEKRILVVDIKYLLSEYKNVDDSVTMREYLEEQYGCNVFLVDSSAQNLQGGSSAYNNPPIYFA